MPCSGPGDCSCSSGGGTILPPPGFDPGGGWGGPPLPGTEKFEVIWDLSSVHAVFSGEHISYYSIARPYLMNLANGDPLVIGDRWPLPFSSSVSLGVFPGLTPTKQVFVRTKFDVTMVFQGSLAGNPALFKQWAGGVNGTQTGVNNYGQPSGTGSVILTTNAFGVTTQGPITIGQAIFIGIRVSTTSVPI